MLKTLEMAPRDPILGLTEAFNQDPNPEKINLGAGVYKDDGGDTPIFAPAKRAEERLLKEESTKSYLGIDGTPVFAAAVQELVFGADHEVIENHRAATAQSPGGTGALRVAGDFIHKVFPEARIWVSDPTWANHPNIFRHAGLTVETYAYLDEGTNDLAFDEMLRSLEGIPEGDVVLLHGCCHNPTGVDPSTEQWSRIADVVEGRGLLLLVDFAYQGLGDGLREDAAGIKALCRPGSELLVASSFSKNFGLYNERVGALTLVAGSAEAAEAALSQVKVCIRANYSNPPAHGAHIVTTVLNDSDLRREWEGEVKAMRDRINGMRRLFVDTLERNGVKRDFSFITRQRGMFSFTGLTKDQVEVLGEEYSIYIVGSGRINVAGITTANIDRLCGAIADALK